MNCQLELRIELRFEQENIVTRCILLEDVGCDNSLQNSQTTDQCNL